MLRSFLSSRKLLYVCLILLSVFAAFSPALENQFVNWDDDVHLTRNPYVQQLTFKNIGSIFTTTVNKTFIPLTTLSFAIERALFGLTPFVYHLTNVLLHMSVCVLVFFFACALGLSLRAGLLTALIFAVHPLHVESVAWVTERKDVLYASLYMAALLSYTRYIHKEGLKYKHVYVDPLEGNIDEETVRDSTCKRYFFLMLVFAFLSMLAKPMALSLPLALFALDWYFKRGPSIRTLLEKAWVAVLLIPVAWMTYALQMRPPSLKFPEAILTWLWCLAFYVKKFFFPEMFVMFYWFPRPVSLARGEYLLAAGVVVLLVLLLFALRKNRIIVFSYLFFFLSIFFLLRFDHSHDAHIVADRFMYLPSLGFCLIFGVLVDRLYEKFQNNAFIKCSLVGTGVLCVLLLGVQSNIQTRVWYNGVTLWTHQWQHQKKAATALTLNKLAEAYLAQDEFYRAAQRIQAGRATPQDKEFLFSVFNMLQMAVAIKPDYSDAYFHLAEFKKQLGLYDEAFELYQRTVQIDAGNFEAFFEMGHIYLLRGEFRNALDAFSRAMQTSPGNRELKNRIEKFSTGRMKSAPAWFLPEIKRAVQSYK